MESLTEKCCAESTQYHINTDPEGDEKDGSVDIHARQRRDNCTSTQKKLTSDKYVGKKSEENEDPMGCDSVASVDDFQVGVASRCVLLDFARQN